mgnify:CR=1 FL=1
MSDIQGHGLNCGTQTSLFSTTLQTEDVELATLVTVSLLHAHADRLYATSCPVNRHQRHEKKHFILEVILSNSFTHG